MKTDQISEFVLGPLNVPEPALDRTSTLLIDTLGIAAGAEGMDAGRIACNHAARFMGAAAPGDAARLLFDGRKVSIPGAAFALATQIDNLDGHDGYNPTKGHIGCAVVPALCAFAEHLPDLKAREALTALTMSYEVAARAGIALHATVSDYHTSGAWNALGVAALGARLRGLSGDQLRHALGIAEYHGPRSQMMREIANPTMLHDGSGMGALVGSMAVLQAEDGFEGAPAITAFSDEAAPYWADLGQLWTVKRNYIKPYPICRWAHAALDALAQTVAEHDLKPEDIASVDVHCFAQAAALYRGIPTSTSQAQYSLPFAMAVLLVHGTIAPDHIQGDGLKDPKVAAVAGRIKVHEAKRHSDRFPASRISDVVIRLKDGAKIASGDVHARGGPEAPMSMDDVKAKFTTMTVALGQKRQARIWAMRDRLLDPDTLFADLRAELISPVRA